MDEFFSDSSLVNLSFRIETSNELALDTSLSKSSLLDSKIFLSACVCVCIRVTRTHIGLVRRTLIDPATAAIPSQEKIPTVPSPRPFLPRAIATSSTLFFRIW
uniref:Uncharacterized protein n=1 Tax=Arundo donax TaxID=35708 RepID=A0A0A9G2A9_ARUDO